MIINQYDRFELELNGPQAGNPFVDVELHAVFENDGRQVRADGFYDGDGIYRIRFMPTRTGEWNYVTKSNRAELDARTGTFECTAPREGRHGPVRVRDKFHFAYDDGTPFYPFGTTAYNWTNQDLPTVEETLSTLKSESFNKIRFSPFGRMTKPGSPSLCCNPAMA